MAARIGTLLGFAQTVLRALWRAVVWLVCGLWRSTGRAARVWELGRALRRLERQRRDDLETLGKLVYVLFKRSLVRNSDLLAQCEKIRGLDVDIDQLLEAGDRARIASRLRSCSHAWPTHPPNSSRPRPPGQPWVE